MKKFHLLTLATFLWLGACAYQPNIPPDQQATPSFNIDLQACQAKQKQMAERPFGPLGLVSLLYNKSQMTDEEVQESNAALDKSTYIDNCMKQKGYTVQQP